MSLPTTSPPRTRRMPHSPCAAVTSDPPLSIPPPSSTRRMLPSPYAAVTSNPPSSIPPPSNESSDATPSTPPTPTSASGWLPHIFSSAAWVFGILITSLLTWHFTRKSNIAALLRYMKLPGTPSQVHFFCILTESHSICLDHESERNKPACQSVLAQWNSDSQSLFVKRAADLTAVSMLLAPPCTVIPEPERAMPYGTLDVTILLASYPFLRYIFWVVLRNKKRYDTFVDRFFFVLFAFCSSAVVVRQ